MRSANIGIVILLAILCFFPSGNSQARPVSITIAHTTDVGGQINSLRYSRRDRGGGLLRCATVVEELRRESSNFLLVDAGGSIYGTPENDLLNGSLTVAAMNLMGYDLYVPAGSDFSRGVESLGRLCEDIEAVKIAANLRGIGGADPIPSIEPFTIIDLDGVRLGFIGLANLKTYTRIHSSFLAGMEWRDSIESLKDAMPALRTHDPDLVILIAHQGLLDNDDADNQIRAIVSEFPSLDVVIGGNTHRSFASAILGDTLYTQAGSRGGKLGVIDIEYDTAIAGIADIGSRLLEISPKIPVDQRISKRLSAKFETAEKALANPIGSASRNFPVAPTSDEVGVRGLILNAIKDASDADIALMPSPVQAVWERRQLERDLWRIFPHDDRVCTMMLTFNELADILQENAGHLGTVHFLGALGLKYAYRRDLGDNLRVSEMSLPNGKVPHPRKRFKVALSSYVLASGGGKYETVRKLARKPRSAADVGNIRVRDALREYFMENSPLDCNVREDGLKPREND